MDIFYMEEKQHPTEKFQGVPEIIIWTKKEFVTQESDIIEIENKENFHCWVGDKPTFKKG